MPQTDKKQQPAPLSFDDLINDITILFKEGLAAAEKAVQYERIRTYWHVGGRIDQFFRSPYNTFKTKKEVYEHIRPVLRQRLNLDLSTDTLQRIVRFYLDYPTLPPQTCLTFNHYKALQRIPDPKLRREVEEQAIREHLSFDDISNIIREFKRAQSDSKPLTKKRVLTYTRGEPYIYCIRKKTDITDHSEYYLDLGFHFADEIPASYTPQLKAGNLVRSTKNKDRSYTFTRAGGHHGILYTYAARVARVIDGDTIDAHIDVGFGHHLINERLRLRGINAPEMSEPEGPAAKQFLAHYLSRCPVIVIRTTKNNAQASADAKGMFGRWLVDIFADPGTDDPYTLARTGTCVNQLLLDKGLADPY